jgi:hypothetical protein
MEGSRGSWLVESRRNSIGILSEALSFSRPHSLVEMTHSNVRPLNGNDVFFDSWNESYIVQSTMQNNSKTWFLGITTCRMRLDREVVASVFAA